MTTPFVMVANGGASATQRSAYSPDGSSWTTATMPTFSNGSGQTWTDVAFSPPLGLFVAIGSGGSNNNNALATSPDGITWTGRSIPQANTWRSICWAGGTINLFVAVSEDGTNRVMTSPDGTTWTVQTAASASAWKSVAYSEDLDMLCAVGSSNVIMTSTNATSWTSQTGPASSKNWNSVVWASGAIQKFVAIASGAGGSNDEMYSSNGTSWTQQTVGAGLGYSWVHIAYSVDLDMLLVVGGNTGVYNRSTNATSWTEVTSGVGSNAFQGSAWSEDLALWCMVANGSLYTSPDGSTWTSRTVPSGSWNKVVAGVTTTTPLPITATNHDTGLSMTVSLGQPRSKQPVIITVN